VSLAFSEVGDVVSPKNRTRLVIDMLCAPIPRHESERLAALQAYQVLDTPPEAAFDRLTQVAQYVMGVPTVLVSLIDADRQWFKSRVGLEAPETPRDISFCGHAVYHMAPLIVPDATADPRFADNPLVTGPPGLRFYVGIPLITPEGMAIGTLCAIDDTPRPAPDERQLDILSKLADEVMAALALRRLAREQSHHARLSATQRQMAAASNEAPSLADAFKVVLAALCEYSGFKLGHSFVQEREHGDQLMPAGEWVASPDLALAAHWFNAPIRHSQTLDPLVEKAMALQAPVLTTDLTQELSARAALARKAGMNSALILPVLAKGRILGLIECYGQGPMTAPTELLALADYAAAQLGCLVERQRLVQLKDEFVHTVSHELRTPLTAISGTLELLEGGLGGPLEPRAHKMVNIAWRNSLRLTRLVTDILDVGKIEAGQMPFDKVRQPLGPLLDQAVAEAEDLASKSQIEIIKQVEEAEIESVVDGDRLLQVLANLLSNALKFSPAGTPVVVSLKRHRQGLRISVADRGPGIPDHFKSRMFEKFAQVSAPNGRAHPGTGLGLAITRHIVCQHGGRITYENNIEAGTTFHVDLPA
jgi:signal transduction histidine kinase